MSSQHRLSGSSTPLIPERYLDVPSQRLYYLSLGLLCQAVKVFDFLWQVTGAAEAGLWKKWMAVDLAYILLLSRLRIPRLQYGTAVIILQIFGIWFLDGLMFGGIHLNFYNSRSLSHHDDSILRSTFGWLFKPTVDEAIEYDGSDAHLLGQHTIRMSPVSTAILNSIGDTFCISPSNKYVLVPLLLNNTSPTSIRYYLTPFGSGNTKREYVDLTTKDIKAIEQMRLDAIQESRPPPSSQNYEYEYDDEDEDISDAQTSLQMTQTLVHLRISRPGILRLERVLDSGGVEARIINSPEVVVAPCPRVQFSEGNANNVRCTGEDSNSQLTIDIRGIPPLGLRWSKTFQGKRESYTVEGIQPEALIGGNSLTLEEHTMKVPLSITLSRPGEYVYELDEVTDSVGNSIAVSSFAQSNEGTQRSFHMLQRPKVSFKHCSPEKPQYILIGSEATLSISASDADAKDAPWKVELQHAPDTSKGSSKSRQPWTRTFTTEHERRELSIPISSPGKYSILSVKGRWCQGDVLAPESCLVLERPRPSAEITWKKIHECSGDTGVLASLILHGTPPFQVYYTVQGDTESPKLSSKTFATSRGELTFKPERSGRHIFSFTHLSDSYYRKVELDGPRIEQVIHPLASADFSRRHGEAGRTKRTISSCQGHFVDVDVELKGTGPWSLEVQVVGPKSSQILTFANITSSQERLQVPIPEQVETHGGVFEIDLISVEDQYKCKRPISTAGISVTVKRVQPTARFYGHASREVTVLEKEVAHLPLRLTGEGPWSIRYRCNESGTIQTTKLHDPNGYLAVREQGLYEILTISDSHCPGTIDSDASTYRVHWTPRPAIQLASDTEMMQSTITGAYVLSPVCQDESRSVELSLSGQPPFDIVYNVAQRNDHGGTRLLDQLTMSSIMHRAKIQLLTSTPGHVFYEVKQLGDAAYPLAQHKAIIIPTSERLLFEQEVYQRPSAAFKNRNRLSACLNEAFTASDPSSPDGAVVLDGRAPFRIRLSVRSLSENQEKSFEIDVPGNSWKLHLPEYHFTSIGPHHVDILSVSDSSGCTHSPLDPLLKSIWVDVAESAAIVPLSKQEHFCVGEVAQFQLEGKPPWSIGYSINGKTYTKQVDASPFSLPQQYPGDFAIATIAHQQKLCRATISDLKYSVHPLPSAQVGHGKRIYQDIHEGDQAEIVFTLKGEPPFTFTYQRAEPSHRKGGKPGKVLETHTVSRIFTHEYSVFSALEGTWTVTSISDRYCRYPPMQMENEMEKGKR